MIPPQIDIKENEIFELSPELLNALLKDHTLSSDTEQINIFWATEWWFSVLDIIGVLNA